MLLAIVAFLTQDISAAEKAKPAKPAKPSPPAPAKPTQGKDTTPAKPNEKETEPVESNPWCIMGMHCVLPIPISEKYKSHTCNIYTDDTLAVEYPYYDCYIEEVKHAPKPPKAKGGVKQYITTLVYNGPATIISNTQKTATVRSNTNPKQSRNGGTTSVSKKPTNPDFSKYGNGNMVLVYYDQKKSKADPPLKVFLMKAPTRINMEMDDNLGLRITFKDFYKSPPVKIGIRHDKTPTEKPYYEEVDTVVCGNDRIASVNLISLYRETPPDCFPLHIYLKPHYEETDAPLLRTIHVCRSEKFTDVRVQLENDQLLLSLSGLKITPNNAVFAVFSDLTTEGTPMYCGGGSPLWSILQLTPVNDSKTNKTSLKLPLYLAGQKVLICASFAKDKEGLHVYNTHILRVSIDTNLLTGASTIINVDAMGKTQIVLSRQLHPLSEIMLVESDKMIQKMVYPPKPDNRGRDVKGEDNKSRDLKVDIDSLKPLGNVSLDVSAIFRRIDGKAALSLQSMHHLVYPPAFSYLIGDKAYWSTNALFLPQMLYPTDKTYTILACDRWKHQHCLSESDFSDIIGAVIPNRFILSKTSATWENDKLTLTVKTMPFQATAPFMKLVKAVEGQLDYDVMCTHGPFIGSLHKKTEYVESATWLSTLSKEKMTYYYAHTYEFSGVDEGIKYCVCYAFYERSTTSTPKIEYPPDVNWRLLTLLNPQVVSRYQRTTVRSEKDTLGTTFVTTGVVKSLKLRQVYMSEDLSYDCEKLVRTQEYKGKTTTLDLGDKVVKTESTFWLPLEKRPKSSESSETLPNGYWLSADRSHWKYGSSYLLYTGPLETKKPIYKACFCYESGCFSGGNMVVSGEKSLDVSRFLDSSVYNSLIVNGKVICVYGKRDVSCFNNTGSLGSTLLSPLDVQVTPSDVRCVAYSASNDKLSVIQDDVAVVYGDKFANVSLYRVAPNIHHLHFTKSMAFVFFSDGYYYVQKINEAFRNLGLQSRSTWQRYQRYSSSGLADLFFTDLKQGKIGDFKGIDPSKYKNMSLLFQLPLTASLTYLPNCTGKALKIEVFNEDDSRNYHLFYIDDEFKLHYSMASVALSLTEDRMLSSIADTESLDLPVGGERPLNITLRCAKIGLTEKDKTLFVFVHFYGHSKIKTFFVKGNKLHPHDDLEGNPRIVDLAFHNSRMYALTRNVPNYGEVSQSIIETDLVGLLPSRLRYPTIPVILHVGESYSFAPEVKSGHFSYFSTEDHVKLERQGFRLDPKYGYIRGVPKFAEKLEVTIEAVGLFSREYRKVSMDVHCAMGSYPHGDSKTCKKCDKGQYWDFNSGNERCLSCQDLIKDSITVSDGSKSHFDCVCPPGKYVEHKQCKECPVGTTSESYNSSNCSIAKVDSQKMQDISSIVVTCNPGMYKKGDTCVHCPVGSYCLGGDMQPIRCSTGMTTQGHGKTSNKDCFCDAGYEWVRGACLPCSRTSYKESIGNTTCTACPSSAESASPLYTPSYGATSQRQCVHCKEGFYFDANKVACVACPADSFCPGEGTIPLFCPSNTITLSTNASSVNDCFCIEGFGYESSTRFLLSLDSPCTQCAMNKFQHINGSNIECMQCPKNTYTMFTGAISLKECLPSPGYYMAGEDNFVAEVTHMESLKPEELQEATVTCAANVEINDDVSISLMASSLQACVDMCKANVYCRYAYYLYSPNAVVHTEPRLADDSLFKGKSICKLIMIYQHTSIPDMKLYHTASVAASSNKSYVLCSITRPNVPLNFNHLEVLRCPMNHYCPGGDKFTKFRCPVNSVTLTSGATEIGHCLCLPGHEFSSQASLPACIPCREGFYKDSTSNARCSACPGKMTTLGKGSISVGQCMCSVGHYAVAKGGMNTYSAPALAASHKYELIQNGTVLTKFLLDYFNINELNTPPQQLASVECHVCPEGYVCPAKWFPSAVFRVHNPPISCPDGSSVPKLAHKADSVAKCICKPGYGAGKSYGEELFVSCQKCAPGTFSETYGTSSCSGRCNDYAITFPGASSFKDCFCLPGRFMTLHLIDDEYKFVCNKCAEGTVCPGGFRDPSSAVSRSDDPQIAILNHMPQYPRMGYMAIFKRKSPHVRDTLRWMPNDSNTYIINPPAPSQFSDYEHVSDIHPCIYPNRCKGSGTRVCLEGSDGYLCGMCERGYETRYFQSACTKCTKKRFEVLRLVLPRVFLYVLVLLVCHLNNKASYKGEFSLIVIFKIWYMFVFSLVPLGMQQLTTSSSLRHFYTLHHNYFYKAITYFMHIERVGCWEPYVRQVILLLNRLGLPKSIIDGSKELNYITIWYLQRVLALSKPVLDVLVLSVLYMVFSILYKYVYSLAAHAYRRKKIELKIKELRDMVREHDSETQERCKIDLEMTLQSLDNCNGRDSTFNRYVKSRKHGCVFLVHQILLTLTLHFPSVIMNSISLLWCSPVRYKEGPEINVLMHLPEQVCDARDPLFKYGRFLGLGNLALWLGLLALLFLMLRKSSYNPRSWNHLFMSGCDINCRWWDVVHLSRQFFLACLIVCQYSMEPKGDTEYMRTTCYLIVHFVYMTLHLTFSPYDDRGNSRFYHLESVVFFSNICICIFIQGSYFYDLSDLDGFPILVSLIVHAKIVLTLMVEYGNVKFANKKDNGKHEFLYIVLDFLPFTWEQRHAKVYYDYKTDNIVLESTEPRHNYRSFYYHMVTKPMTKLRRILGFSENHSSDPNSCSYSLHNRDFLISCIRTSIEKSNIFADRMVLSNTWLYFMVRYVFWYCHCLHKNILDKDLTPNALFHQVVFLHFFYKNNESDHALAKFFVEFPIQKLASHASVHHNGEPCDGTCEVFNASKKKKRVDEVAESLLVDCLFDTMYDFGPVSLVEFYFGLLSLNQLKNCVVLRLFEGFRIHSLFLKDENEFHLMREALALKGSISVLKKKIEERGELGTASLHRHNLVSQIEEVECSIEALKENIKREEQIIMAGRAAAAAALNLHLGIDKFVTEELSHDDILSAISSLPGGGTTEVRNDIFGSDVGFEPVFKLGG